MTFNIGAGQSPSSMVGPSGRTGNKIPSGYKSGQLQQFTPEQMQLFQQMFGHLGPDSYTSRLAGGDQSLFGEMEAPALRQFSGQMGNLASRFSGMGMGARNSSGFQNTATAAASNFSQDLQSQRQALQRQAIMDLMGMGNSLLSQRPYENFLVKKQQNPWASIAGQFAGAIPGAVVGGLTGGWGGAAQGIGGALSGFGGGNASASFGY